MAYASRLYPRAKPRGFTPQWIKKPDGCQAFVKSLFDIYLRTVNHRLNRLVLAQQVVQVSLLVLG